MKPMAEAGPLFATLFGIQVLAAGRLAIFLDTASCLVTS
jgi:hypothetical protein